MAGPSRRPKCPPQPEATHTVLSTGAISRITQTPKGDLRVRENHSARALRNALNAARNLRELAQLGHRLGS